MRHMMKKLIPFMLALVMLVSCAAFAKAEATDEKTEAAAFAPERLSNPVVKNSPTAVMIKDSRTISAIRLPMIWLIVP